MKLKMILACFMSFCLVVLAQDSTKTGSMGKTSTTQTQKDKTHTDMPMQTMKGSDFTMKAADGGMMEVKLGNIVKDKALSKDVKDFGEMMVKDHSAANKELKTIAKKNNIMLPVSLMKKHQEAIDKLSKLSGTEFDKEYISMMVDDHKKDIAEFEDAANNEPNADVKEWAQKTLPTLRQHLAKAQEIERNLNSVSRGNK